VKAGVYRGWFTVDGCKDVGSIFITRFCLFIFILNSYKLSDIHFTCTTRSALIDLNCKQ
jgi:hypothetical protein